MDELQKIFYTTNTISNPSEIASALVPVVQNCTSTEFPETLIDYVGEVAEKQPRDIETICKALSILLGNPQIQEKRLDGPDCSLMFIDAFSLALSEKISDGLGDVFAEDGIGNLSIDSTNVCLTAALLSASAIKHNLQHVSQRIPQAIVLLGLQDPDPRLMPKPKKNEVYGVVALIHLAVVGDKMAEKVERRLSIDGGVKNALESLKKKRVFKSPSSVELLKVCIVFSHNSFHSPLILISMLLPMWKAAIKRTFPRMKSGTCFSPPKVFFVFLVAAWQPYWCGEHRLEIPVFGFHNDVDLPDELLDFHPFSQPDNSQIHFGWIFADAWVLKGFNLCIVIYLLGLLLKIDVYDNY